jgi:hypothetical protein
MNRLLEIRTYRALTVLSLGRWMNFMSSCNSTLFQGVVQVEWMLCVTVVRTMSTRAIASYGLTPVVSFWRRSKLPFTTLKNGAKVHAERLSRILKRTSTRYYGFPTMLSIAFVS